MPAGRRKALQRRCVSEGWSKRRLDAEIRKRFGNRQPTPDRRQASPETAEDAYYAIARLRHQWQRLMEALDRPPQPDGEEARATRPELPPTLTGQLRPATKAVAAVGKLVSEKLDADTEGAEP